MRASRRSLLVAVLVAAAASCTRSVDDLETYDACFVDRECDDALTDGCFRLIGDTATLGVCSVFCEGGCPNGGICTDRYEPKDDTSPLPPICAQPCASSSECPQNGFVCTGGACLPP